MENVNMRYPRGKSWNWYKRAMRAGGAREFNAVRWASLRAAKRDMTTTLFKQIYGHGDGVELTGLDQIINTAMI